MFLSCPPSSCWICSLPPFSLNCFDFQALWGGGAESLGVGGLVSPLCRGRRVCSDSNSQLQGLVRVLLDWGGGGAQCERVEPLAWVIGKTSGVFQWQGWQLRWRRASCSDSPVRVCPSCKPLPPHTHTSPLKAACPLHYYQSISR